MTTIDDLTQGRVPWGSPLLCPFHADHTASAHLYDDGHFHCYACGAHADSYVDLLRKLHFADEPFDRGMSLAAILATRQLGRLGGGPPPRKREGASRPAIRAMTLFTELTRRALARDQRQLDELYVRRGLRDPVALGLGLAQARLVTQARELLAQELTSDAVDAALCEAGICYEDGNYRLANRLLIPEIREQQTIFYQARTRDGHRKKYLNPALPRPLFGLESLRREGELAFISEGPFDVLPFLEEGLPAVAVLGSHLNDTVALSEGLQGRIVVVGFDRDPTGLQKGAFLAGGLKELGLEAVHLPPPEPFTDYSEWIATRGAEQVLARIYWELP